RLSHDRRRSLVEACLERTSRSRVGCRTPRGIRVRRGPAVLRNPERLGLDLAARWRGVGRGGARPPPDPLGRSRRRVAVAIVLLPSMLAAEAGGQKRFELEAATVGDALRQLPVANLLFNEHGDLRRLINVYVD